MTDFFKITEQSRPGTSTERNEENYSVQEKEDYDDQHQSDCEFPENVSCDLPANTQPSISKISESQFTPIPDDPCKWPESISDAQRCDIVKRGPHQLIMNFPYNNTTPRRFSSNHYKRVLPNGESVSRSWLVYSGESDQVFCFCCKLFGKTLSPFCSGINTWEGFSKKLKDHCNNNNLLNIQSLSRVDVVLLFWSLIPVFPRTQTVAYVFYPQSNFIGNYFL